MYYIVYNDYKLLVLEIIKTVYPNIRVSKVYSIYIIFIIIHLQYFIPI